MNLALKSSPATEFSASPAEFKFASDGSEAGRFSGYGSIFGNVDNGGDMIQPGAFSESLKARGARGVKMLWQHNTEQPIGVWEVVSEDTKGLYVEGRFFKQNTKAREAYEMAAEGAVDGLSIGYRSDPKFTKYEKGAGGQTIRVLSKLDLFEVSLVTFPMNTRATVTAVKTMPTDRELEAMLRDEAGLSNRDAKAALSVIKKTLRDGGETEQAPRDAEAEAISRELQKLLANLRS